MNQLSEHVTSVSCHSSSVDVGKPSGGRVRLPPHLSGGTLNIAIMRMLIRRIRFGQTDMASLLTDKVSCQDYDKILLTGGPLPRPLSPPNTYMI